MAINVSFGGATIYKPGAYSKQTIDLGGNIPLGPAGLVAIVGEADAGEPGSAVVDISQNFFTGEQFAAAKAKYRSGPIVDALNFLFAPASDGAIPGGAQVVWVYKTNASVRASIALANAYGTVRAREWGIGGNRISAKVTLANNGQATTSGTPAAFGAALNGVTFNFRLNGGALATVTLSSTTTDHDTLAHLVTELNGLVSFNASLIASASGTSLVIKSKTYTNKHRNGYSQTFELIDAVPGDLAKLGLTAGQKVPAAEQVATIKIDNKRDNIQEEDIIGGNVVLKLRHDSTGGATSASVTIDATQITLTTSVGSDALDKAAFTTLGQVVEAINLITGWSAELGDALYSQLSPAVLDNVTSVGAFAVGTGVYPAMIKKDAYEVAKMFEESGAVEIVSQAKVGLPDALTETMLTGGAKGGTLPADVVAGLAKFEKFHVNAVVPLFSRDATDDIADGLTDVSSTYTIDGVHQAVKTHIALMKTIKKRSERQGYLSFKGSYADCKTKANTMADGRLQMTIQDVRQVDSAGNIKWFQPWALAAMVCGARCGSPIGLPMTFKFMNCSGVRQTGQAMTTEEADIVLDFDPDTQYDDAIQSGITFAEAPQTGGFRIVVDNTTYGVDDNWVWNRGNVIYAADIVSFNFRNTMERRYVGVKNTVRAAEVKSTAESVLGTFLTQGVTVSTPDAPQGFKDISVTMNGNTINISVTVKLVEGVDFVLADITVQRATQTA